MQAHAQDEVSWLVRAAGVDMARLAQEQTPCPCRAVQFVQAVEQANMDPLH